MQWNDIIELPLYVITNVDNLMEHLGLTTEDRNIAQKVSDMALVLLGYEQYKPSTFKENVQQKVLFSNNELIELFFNFVRNPMLKSSEMVQLADKMNLPIRSVKGWFYNKRSDLKEGKLTIPPLVQEEIGVEIVIKLLEAFQTK
ncbi:Homeobox domain-containing protein [Spironucleus salmonicida]|uniref:Homeobox domain-containing protein n=1 Tax=Spironucleus salmonicida TaxID=348837 RepID=V6LNQ1_9EUKA|nr:Homeobox domain-containing protein [Spironucleus salmonicida]|eukprot:EST46225.1 Homeobox domain-containing protein [Spironucleus salmonicida]